MPLPKPPTKPAALLDPASFTEARPARSASRPKLRVAEAAPPEERARPDAATEPESATPTASAGAVPAGRTGSRRDRAKTPQAPADVSARKAAAVPVTLVEAIEPSASPPPIESLTPAAAPAFVESPMTAATMPLPSSGNGRSAPTTRSSAVEAAPRQAAGAAPKLFVLDTNVLMHDPTSLFRFEEHDVYLPMMTLEELDNHKKGMTEVARNARQVSRSLDALFNGDDAAAVERGIPLAALGNDDARGSLFIQAQELGSVPPGLPSGKADNQILGVVRALKDSQPGRQVVLVSKDINMRVKARALGLAAEDYYNDQVIEDTDLLYSGVLALPPDFWDLHGKGIESWQQAGSTFYRVTGPLVPAMHVNQFVHLEGDTPLAARVREINARTAVLQTLRDFTHHKNAAWGVIARNREQNFALNLLMDPDIDFVSLLGQAGTGKTLLTLAAGLTQALEHKRYSELIVTRATVPVGEDIGYLPGTEEEKMQPWMGALEDNLEVLQRGEATGGDWGRSATQDLIRSRIRVKALSFMRGRTFIQKYLIIDEAQNLTPKQMKTLITRAGPGTKVVCLGNIAQIDTPYLTESSSGLTYVVDRFKGWAHAGHVTLQRGERSRLADFATDAL